VPVAEPHCPQCRKNYVITERHRPSRSSGLGFVAQFVIAAGAGTYFIAMSDGSPWFLGLGVLMAALAIISLGGWFMRSSGRGVPALNVHTCTQCQHSWFSPAATPS